MLEVSPDTLIQRDKQRQRKKIIWSSLAALFFVMLVIGLSLWTWDRYYRVHVGYYTDYVEYWGVPRGLFPLTPEQRAHRQEHYRIYTQNQKVIRLERVNSAGVPIPVEESEFKDRPMIAVYPIYKDGRLVQRDMLDNNGKIMMSHLYSGNQMQKVEFKSFSNDDTASSTVLTKVTSTTTFSLFDPSSEINRGEIGNMRLIRDSEGQVIEERFQKGSYNIPTTDEQGIAGFRYKLDEYGRVIEKIYLDQNGVPYPDKKGIVRRTYQYDNHGNLTVIKYIDSNGRLISNELGWIQCIQSFDNYGNPVATKFVDALGKLSMQSYLIAGSVCKFDERGNEIERSYFGIDGKPCLQRRGYAKIKCKYDQQGNKIEQACFGLDGKPCLRQFGYSIIRMKYDERRNKIEEAFFGVDGNPRLTDGGFAKITWKYDEHGKALETVYFDAEGKPLERQ